MRIWLDADACPIVIRDLVIRAAQKRGIAAIFVANKALMLPTSEHISFVLVENSPDAADAYIVKNAQAGDLAVTQDIPLAAQLVPMGVTVISPRGDSFNTENIGDRLANRNLLDELRTAGTISGGPAPFDEKMKRQFANLFDTALQRLTK